MGNNYNFINQMQVFYNIFPYPKRSLLSFPVKKQHLYCHGGFYALLQKGNYAIPQSICSAHLAKKTLTNHKQILTKLEQNFGRNNKILLVGCGTDEPLLFRILHPGNMICAIDLSKKSVKYANIRIKLYSLNAKILFRKIAKTHFICADANVTLEQKNLGEFDFIQCFGVLHHQQYPAQLFHNMENSLAKNGILRLMVYSAVGRRLERRIQNKNNALWKNSSTSRLQIWMSIFKLWFWLLLHKLKRSNVSSRFAYLQNSFNTIADAFLHPSDAGFSLTELNNLINKTKLKIIFCEAKTYTAGWLIGIEDAPQVWLQILAAESGGNLSSNVTIVLQKQ